jgi:Tat protein secretion system quality control protein TatD with DNase activity
MLSRGASPYDVAKMLGDTIDTVERHYTPFVKELRERVRNIVETGTDRRNRQNTSRSRQERALKAQLGAKTEKQEKTLQGWGGASELRFE